MATESHTARISPRLRNCFAHQQFVTCTDTPTEKSRSIAGIRTSIFPSARPTRSPAFGTPIGCSPRTSPLLCVFLTYLGFRIRFRVSPLGNPPTARCYTLGVPRLGSPRKCSRICCRVLCISGAMSIPETGGSSGGSGKFIGLHTKIGHHRTI